MARATAYNTVELLKPILKTILANEGELPKRIFTSQSQMESYFKGINELTIDASEYPTQRPVSEEKQADLYSKKNISTASKIRS